MRNAVVTGGAGFVGSALVRRLLAEGWRVTVLDNHCTGRPANLAEVADAIEMRTCDITEPFDVEGPVDVLFHLASPASPPDYLARGIATLRVNAIGTEHALRLAERKGATFFLASTSEVYGDPLEHPQRETYWGNVNPVGPRSVYDEGKRFAEALTMAWHRERGLDTRIVRVFNTYGPRMRLDDGRVVVNFIVQALRGEALTVYGDGSQTRSFCYVDDLIAGMLAVVHRGDAWPYNLGDPQEHSVRTMASMICDLVGQGTVELRPLPTDDPKRRQPDIQRAREALGWAPSTPLREGLERTLADVRRRMVAAS